MTAMKSFFEVHFSRSSSWLASELSPTVITTSLDVIRHFFNFLRYFLDQLPEFKFTSPNESTSLLTEAKTRSDYDVIEGNESGATSLISRLLGWETEHNWLITRNLSWLSSSVINALLYFIIELKMTDHNFLICFLVWRFRHGYRSN